MKKRMGWVSNSSSSSFCILGINSGYIKLPEEFENNYYALENNSCLTIKSGIDDYADTFCIGISPYKIGENETILEAKQRVVDALKEKGIEVSLSNIHWMIDGGYDG